MKRDKQVYAELRRYSRLGMKVDEPVADLEPPSRLIKDFFSADEAIRDVS